MIIEKAPPSMGRWDAMANHILGDGSLGNGDAQLRQLAMHAGSSPERVGPAHIPYQLTYFGSDAWSSRPTPSALPSPISSEPTTVPADDRLRFHDDEDALPVSPDSAQQHPKLAVDLRESRGRFTERRRTASCCRRATFSRASSRRALKAEMRARTNDEIMPAWCWQTGD